MTTSRRYKLIDDPIFYITIAFFSVLTTALPAIIGQPLLMPIVQTIALFAFMTITWHQQRLRQTLWVVGVWLVLQFLSILLLTMWAEQRVQQAFAEGFLYRMAYVDWYYAGAVMPDAATVGANALRPDSFAVRPLARIIELVGISIGSLISMGLIGIWFLVRAVNLAAFSMGSVVLASGEAKAIFGALPLWSLLRIGGYASAVILLAEPLLASNWNPLFYIRERRRLLLVSITLILVGLLLELFLPNLWRTLFR